MVLVFSFLAAWMLGAGSEPAPGTADMYMELGAVRLPVWVIR
jgi:hypothetical protein